MRTKYLAAAAVLATSSVGMAGLEAPAAHADTLLTYGCNTNSNGTVCLAVSVDVSGNKYQQVAFTSNATYSGGMNASYNGQIHGGVYLGQFTANVTAYSVHDALPATSGDTVCGSAWKTNSSGGETVLDFVCLTTP